MPEASSEKASLICMASSRVGVRISAFTPVSGPWLVRRSSEREQKGKSLACAGLRRDHQIVTGELLEEWPWLAPASAGRSHSARG